MRFSKRDRNTQKVRLHAIVTISLVYLVEVRGKMLRSIRPRIRRSDQLSVYNIHIRQRLSHGQAESLQLADEPKRDVELGGLGRTGGLGRCSPPALLCSGGLTYCRVCCLESVRLVMSKNESTSMGTNDKQEFCCHTKRLR